MLNYQRVTLKKIEVPIFKTSKIVAKIVSVWLSQLGDEFKHIYIDQGPKIENWET